MRKENEKKYRVYERKDDKRGGISIRITFMQNKMLIKTTNVNGFIGLCMPSDMESGSEGPDILAAVRPCLLATG